MENKKLELLNKLFSCQDGREVINVALENAEYLNTVLKNSGEGEILPDYDLILNELNNFSPKNEEEDWAIDAIILFLQEVSKE